MSIDYTVNVNTSQATANLERLKGSISGLTDKFSGLKSAIAGLAFATGTAAVLEYANGIKDISEITGVAIANVVGFTKAVSENNGSVEQGQAGLVKLVSAIGQAAEGSATAQDAFAQVGVSLNDLRTLSEQDILAKTLKNLAAMKDSGQRLVLVNELLGKSFRSVNLQGVANDYEDATKSSEKYTSSIQSAAQLQNNLETAISRFKLALLQSIQPMADFINKLKPDQINQFIDAIIKIGGAVGGLVAFGKALEWVVAIGGTLVSWMALAGRGWAAFKLGLGVLTEGIVQFGRTFVIAFSVLKNYSLPAWIASGTVTELLGAMGETVAMLGKRFAFFFASIIAGTAGLGLMGAGLVKMLPVVGWIVTAITALNYIIKLAFGIDVIDVFLQKLGVAYEKFKAFLGLSKEDEKKPGGALPPTGAGGGRGVSTTATEDQIKRGQELEKEAAAELERKREAARKVADAYAKQRIEIRQASIEFAKYGDELVLTKQREIDLIGRSAEQQDLMSAQAEVVKKTKDEIEKLVVAKTKLSEADLRAGLGGEYDAQIAKIKKLGAADEERIAKEIANLHRRQDAEAFVSYELSKRIEFENQLQSLVDENAKMKLPALEQKYYDLETAAKAASKAAIEAEEARRGRPLTEDEKKPFEAIAKNGLETIKKQTKENYDASRSWSTGWANAFNEYVDNATNAANYARDIFQQTTSGMSDMIVNFAKTGKLEWKSFVNDMLTTLLRSQLQQTIAKVFGALGGAGAGSSGGGGLFGGKIIPGFLASGGPASMNRPYIVGENGPELFLPNVNGTVAPNSALQGGGSNVTYNISAVDARSFQALVAQDPQFIHAVAMAGARDTARR